jgi:hypothetical protein
MGDNMRLKWPGKRVSRVPLPAALLLAAGIGCGQDGRQELSNANDDAGTADAGKYCEYIPKSASCASGPLFETIKLNEAVLVDGRLLKLHEISYLDTIPIANIRILDDECNFIVGMPIKEGSYGETSLPSGGSIRAYVRKAALDEVAMQIQRECERTCLEAAVDAKVLNEGGSLSIETSQGRVFVNLEQLNENLGWAMLSISDEQGEKLWTLHIPESDYTFADLWYQQFKITVRSLDMNLREADVHVRVQECTLP